MRHWLVGLLWLLACGAALSQEHEQTTRPWWQMIVPREMLSLSLSPDGSKLAGLTYNGFGATEILVDVQTHAAKDIVKPEYINKAWIYTRSAKRVRWIRDDLLAVDFNDDESESFDLHGKKLADLGDRFIRPLDERQAGGDWVLAYSNVKSGAIARVDARTGRKEKFSVPPGRLVHWAFDARGELRAVTMMNTSFWSDKTRLRNWYRVDEKSDWQLLQEASVSQEYWQPLYVPAEPDSLVVLSREDRDTTAVFRYDVRQRRAVDVMAAHASEDIVSVSGLDQAVFQSVRTAGLKPRTFWFDARWAALQAAVDAALPGQINVLSGNPQGRILVHSWSDIDPGRWYLLETGSMALKEIAQASSGIPPEAMRPMSTLHYPSFDGLRIPAYLTVPADTAGPSPMVVVIHGGPQARDEWAWDQEVQILAMNGYAVFQPQFRGSAGFGKAFELAGYEQWGRAMQDDITAGVQYLIDQKIADPRRICILGASYGGYAALWGVIKTPHLYRCGISYAGVTDIAHMLDDWSDRNSDAVTREVQSVRVGSIKDGKDRFDDVSPLKSAGKVQVPLFISHGERDERVPVSHSEKMVGALKDNGKEHEWLPFPREGHGLTYVADITLYYSRLLAFLSRNIGPESVAKGRNAAPATANAAPAR